MKAFKAYDIRGEYPSEVNETLAYNTGYYIPSLLNAKKVLIGRDVRNSSNSLFEALSRGICDAGADVYDAGETTTPMVYFGTAKYNFDASVQITASHNPAHHNGMKVSGKDALPIGFDNGLGQIKKWISEGKFINPTRKGQIFKINIIDDFMQFMQKYTHDLPNLKVCVDCSNGMAAGIINKLLPKNVNYINNTRDGNFPGHDPNPLNPNNLHQIRNLLLKSKADIGVIFDGDADRVMFLDEKGQFISPDLMIAALGHYFLKGDAKDVPVLQDIRTSKAVGEYLTPMGANINMWRVGRAYAAPKLKEIGGLFGGELAGHYYFKDFYYSDSGIMASLIALQVFQEFKSKDITASELISNISPYFSSGEINFRLDKKQEAMDAVLEAYTNDCKPDAFYDFDGYRLEYPDFWINIRPSNTEPYLRFIAEANSEDKLKNIVDRVKGIVERF